MYTREADHGIPRIISRAAIVNPPLRALDIRQNSSGLDDEGLSPVFFLFFFSTDKVSTREENSFDRER